MPEIVELVEKPTAREMYMIMGWRQWADAGSVSSGLPDYLIQKTGARRIGTFRSDSFYLFQIPGTHDLVRPVVKFKEGFPESLETPRNELFYTGDDQRGFVIFVGDEPHLDMERYTAALLDMAQTLKVRRIIGLGGVYGEFPYNKERLISVNYSMQKLKDELNSLAISFSDYHGGASVGSYFCRRSADRHMEYVGLYALVPAYSFSSLASGGDGIRIENDFMAWLGIMRRINYMFKAGFDLVDLEEKSEQVVQVMDAKIAKLDKANPELGIRDYLANLSEGFTEMTFAPLGDVWEEELRRLLDDDTEENNF
jgi:predicted ATP-grasp superfamily ATP-dependent carboligase